MAGGLQTPISDEAKALVIGEYLAGNTKHNIAQRMGLSWATVAKIVKGYEPEVQAALAEERKGIAASGVKAAKLYLEKLSDPATVKATKPRDAAVIYGILMDKSQREQELALTFEAMLDEAMQMLKDGFRRELHSDTELYNRVNEHVEKTKIAVQGRLQYAIEEHQAALKYRVRKKRVVASEIECVSIGGVTVPKTDVMAYIGAVDVDMQLEILDMWNARQAE